MPRRSLSSILASVFALALVPALVGFGISDLPSLGVMRASKTADILWVWVLTWGLILLGVGGALIVSWLAWSADSATHELAASTGLDDLGSRPNAPSQRSVA
jgi:hypothetical protein